MDASATRRKDELLDDPRDTEGHLKLGISQKAST